jgi:hypothetical protein
VKLVQGSDWVVLVGREEVMPETRIDMGMKGSVSGREGGFIAI